MPTPPASRESLTVLAQKRDDPNIGIFVFFPEEAKVGIKPIRRYCDKMHEEQVTRAILVVQDAMTSHAKQALKETITLGLHMEHFQARASAERAALTWGAAFAGEGAGLRAWRAPGAESASAWQLHAARG